MHDLYLKQEEEFEKEDFSHWHSKSSSFERLPNSMKDIIKTLRKSHTIALLDKAIEEMEGEKKEVEPIMPDESLWKFHPFRVADFYENKGLSTAISHLTNLRNKLLAPPQNN